MSAIGFHLGTWRAWTHGYDLEGGGGDVPALLRRRVTPLGRDALNMAWGLPETANARLVLSSRHGEFSRTLSLLESVATGEGLSPADFTLSVHHALIGLLSIANRNRRGHTAVAAGEESFCFGLLEAAACALANPKEPVVLLHFDEPLPGPYSLFNETTDQPVAMALALMGAGEGESIKLNVEPSPAGGMRSVSHALDFLQFLQNGEKEKTSLSEQRKWKWTRNALI